jgi:cbb3-type cytochrome oxidase maturation protein
MKAPEWRPQNEDRAMTSISVLLPIALVMGLAGLVAFLWSVRAGQYDDLDGAANRILTDEEDGPC